MKRKRVVLLTGKLAVGFDAIGITQGRLCGEVDFEDGRENFFEKLAGKRARLVLEVEA